MAPWILERRAPLFKTSGDRYEWDASGGIYIHPYVALLGGYKKVRQEIDFFTTQETVDLATGATIAIGSASSSATSTSKGRPSASPDQCPSVTGSVCTRAMPMGSWTPRSESDVAAGTETERLTPTLPTMSPSSGFRTPTERRVWLLICPSLQQRSTPATDTRTSAPSSMSRFRTART